jgi:hypothetical protein
MSEIFPFDVSHVRVRKKVPNISGGGKREPEISKLITSRRSALRILLNMVPEACKCIHIIDTRREATKETGIINILNPKGIGREAKRGAAT